MAGRGGCLRQTAAAGIPPERTLLLGFSQGACLAPEFAARHARRYGGVAALSGGLIGPDGTPQKLSPDPWRNAGVPRLQRRGLAYPCRSGAGVSGRCCSGLAGRSTMRLYPGNGAPINEDEIAAVLTLLAATAATPWYDHHDAPPRPAPPIPDHPRQRDVARAIHDRVAGRRDRQHEAEARGHRRAERGLQRIDARRPRDGDHHRHHHVRRRGVARGLGHDAPRRSPRPRAARSLPSIGSRPVSPRPIASARPVWNDSTPSAKPPP